jgi:pyruvate,water dikinase
LVSKGLLDGPDDIFYLHVDEVCTSLRAGSLDLRDVVDNRKDEMAFWGGVTPPPFIGAPPSSPERNSPEDLSRRRFFGEHELRADQPNLLLGNGGSAGAASGPARVLLNLNEAGRLRPGDVLVTRTTMPPWTPLFAVACAVVVEIGGVLSHAAVTAREYGIPAVLGVSGATRTIRDGQMLMVDGTKGTVRFLS